MRISNATIKFGNCVYIHNPFLYLWINTRHEKWSGTPEIRNIEICTLSARHIVV